MSCACTGRCRFPPYTCDGSIGPYRTPWPPGWGGGEQRWPPVGRIDLPIDYERLADEIVKRLKEQGA